MPRPIKYSPMNNLHTIDKEKYQPRLALLAGGASLATVVVLLIAKGFTFGQTGSASVFASLMDSVLDASVSLMMFMAIRYSLKPADKNHRHGHGKIEGLAALFQAMLLAVAAGFLLWEAAVRFVHPEPVRQHGLAIIVMVLTIIVSAILVMVQNYTLKCAASLAVEADKAHYGNDIIVNGGVIATIVALYFGAPYWVDPLFAVLVAMYIIFTIFHIGRKGIDMLLDRELPGPVRDEITRLVSADPGVMGMHDLRTSRSGMRIFISFDLEVDPDLSLRDAHEIARAVEGHLLNYFPHAEIMIHVDPHGDTDDSRHTVAGVHH